MHFIRKPRSWILHIVLPPTITSSFNRHLHSTGGHGRRDICASDVPKQINILHSSNAVEKYLKTETGPEDFSSLSYRQTWVAYSLRILTATFYPFPTHLKLVTISWNRLTCVLALSIYLKIWNYLQTFKKQKILYFKSQIVVFLGKTKNDLHHWKYMLIWEHFSRAKAWLLCLRGKTSSLSLIVSFTPDLLSFSSPAWLWIWDISKFSTWVLVFYIQKRQRQGIMSSEKKYFKREKGK